ncbi:MAG: DUF2225 domain-containing protein [Candidatus Zixiibacteriota bacterium]
MADDTPFYYTKVECPICKTVNEYETVRVGAYIERGRDTDFCPLDIQWRFPRYQAYNPLVFFVATCSNCCYSREFGNSFREWKKDNTFRMYRLKQVKERHLDQLAQADSVVKKLGLAIDFSHYPNESAIVKLHLAIFDEQLCDHQSKLDLGRFYLRIAWVFRTLGSGEDPSRSYLRGLMTELNTQYEEAVSAVDGCIDRIETFSGQVETHFKEADVPAETRSTMMPFREQFESALAVVAETCRQEKQQIDAVKDIIDEYRSATLGGDGGGNAFGSSPSFTDFLTALGKRWSGIVASEQEALAKAIQYYKEAFTEGRDISPGNQQIQASYLIAELSRRIGDYDGAREYFNSTIRAGQDFIYRHRTDQSRTALARKILELAIEQGRSNMDAMKVS